MAPLTIDLRSVDDLRDVVHRAVQALAEGKLVAFPTETVYEVAASALCEPAVRRLAELRYGDPPSPLTLAVKSLDEACDYVPDCGPVAYRLARRCWPGPVTLALARRHPDSLWWQLPDAVREATDDQGAMRFRVPAHHLIVEVMRMLGGPLALASEFQPGGVWATTGGETAQALGDRVQLVLDDGRSRYGQPDTIARMNDGELEVLRPGVVPEATLRRLASLVILFVCTGNTCRSPMAEAMCRAMLAERLGCRPGELADRGILVESAGVSAMAGGRPSPEAVDVLRDQGISLSEHRSQPVTESLIQQADLVLAMTQGHRAVILSHFPQAFDRVHLLCADRSDVADPIGGPVEEYRRCARQIRQELGAWLDRLGYR